MVIIYVLKTCEVKKKKEFMVDITAEAMAEITKELSDVAEKFMYSGTTNWGPR